MSLEHFDVLIVGAGLSGVGAAAHLKRLCPDKTFVVLEGRTSIGGTWDLFRYPGIRSDSDMYTLGYAFKPWTHPKAIADGASILSYIRETASEHGIEPHIRLGHRVHQAAWSSAEACWTVEAERVPSGERVRFRCHFLFMCSGYYNYEQGHSPTFPGSERFAGRIVHPQRWTPDIDYTDKRVVVIGSGATAVTLVPAMTDKAAHVTMLQRSPTYMVSRPARDAIANGLRRVLPGRLAYGLTRWKNVLLTMFFYQLARRRPERVKTVLIDRVRQALGPGHDVERHFSPRYKPWDQRVCLVPDGDLFDVIRQGRASVVTDHIDTFTETGIRLKSGQELPADVIVTATGLDLLVLGGVSLSVDGRAVDVSKTMCYKGMMLGGVPNLALAFGYTNASWTLKCDLTCEYVCRLLKHMDSLGMRQCMPKPDPSVQAQPFIDFSSGYVLRALDRFPRQGARSPWRLYQNYALDIASLRWGSVEDEAMQYSNPAKRALQAAA